MGVCPHSLSAALFLSTALLRPFPVPEFCFGAASGLIRSFWSLLTPSRSPPPPVFANPCFYVLMPKTFSPLDSFLRRLQAPALHPLRRRGFYHLFSFSGSSDALGSAGGGHLTPLCADTMVWSPPRCLISLLSYSLGLHTAGSPFFRTLRDLPSGAMSETGVADSFGRRDCHEASDPYRYFFPGTIFVWTLFFQ